MKNFDGSAIERIKMRWPLRDMAQRLGIELPRRDNQKFRHPFRPDRNPSCTVHGEAIHDWSQGDGKPIDVIALYALAKGMDNKEAIRELLREGAEPRSYARETAFSTPDKKAAKPPKDGSQTPKAPPWKKLEEPTPDEIARLVALRGFYRDAVFQAIADRHLFCADTREGRAWIVTDGTGQLSQSRRLDGKPWECIGSKAWTTVKEPGLAGWPLGAADIADRPQVLLCEGGPDWIVAHEALPQFAVCTMLGAKQVIHASALRYFGGKGVRILAHGDDAGREASRRWALQLATVQARVTAVHIRFGQARDLNDCVKLSMAEYLHHRISTLLS